MQTILRAGPPLQHLSSQTQRETNLARLFVVGLVLCCLFSHQQLCFCPHETRMLLFSHDLSWSTIACWKSLLGYQENIHLLWWAISMAMRWMTRMYHFPIKDSSFNSRSFWKATRNHHCRSHLKSWRRVSSLHWTLLLKAGFPVALLIYCVWSQVDSRFRKNSKCTWLWLWFQKIASHLLFCYFCFNWGDSQEKNTINTDHREPFRNRPRAFFCFTFSRFWDLRP